MDLYAFNLTASDQLIKDLGITVPTSGYLQLLPDLNLEEVHSSDGLYTLINTDILLLSYNGSDNETKANSLDILQDISKEHLDIVEEIEQARNDAMKEPTGFINRTDSQMSFVEGGGTPRTFTIQPTLTSYGYYISGELQVKTGIDSVQITDVTGRHYIYFEGLVLKSTTVFNLDLIRGSLVFVAQVYWNVTTQKAIGKPADERHGIKMDGDNHYRWHKSIGPTHTEGLEIGDYTTEGDGTSNGDTRFSLTNGIFEDEDIDINIIHADTLSNPFEQVLKHLSELCAYIPVWYMLGAPDSYGVGTWHQDVAVHTPLKWNAGTSHIQYNRFDSDILNEWILEDVPYGRYIAIWVFSTDDQDQPIKAMLGREVSASLNSAKIDNDVSVLDIGELHYRDTTPLAEVKILYRLIYKTLGNATNDFKAILAHKEDLRPATYIGAASATFALASQVAEVENILGTSLKNTMLNSLEIARLKSADLHPDFTYFVDVFSDDEEIDPESTNYVINENEGYAGLDQGGNYSVKDTTTAQFDEGSHDKTEAYLDFGGDGAIRKEQLVIGEVLTIENFEDLANVATSGAATQARSEEPGTFSEGEASLGITVDFSGASLSETAETEINFAPYNKDISTYKYLRLYFLKPNEGAINYDIEVEDGVAATWNSVSVPLGKANIFQVIEIPISSITGIDKTNVLYIRFRLYEQSTGQVILDVAGEGATRDIYDGREGEQTFQVAQNYTCQRIRLFVSGNTPTEPLYIALADVFGSSLALSVIQPGDVTGTLQYFYLTLSTPVDLVAGIQYKVRLYSLSGGVNNYTVGCHADTYTEGAYFQNGGEQNVDLNFILYTPAIFETIYIDNLELEAESIFEATGTFVSHGINLGIVPDTLDTLLWSLVGTHDTVRVRVKFADAEGNLAAAPWSGYYTDFTGVGNNLTGLTPNIWFQYEVSWSGADNTDSDHVNDVTLEYSASAGTGSATIISVVETTSEVADQFIAIWSDIKGSGSINYYISRDGKNTWQHILEGEAGEIVEFSDTDPGTSLHLKAIITGNARLYNWMFATDKEFI